MIKCGMMKPVGVGISVRLMGLLFCSLWNVAPLLRQSPSQSFTGTSALSELKVRVRIEQVKPAVMHLQRDMVDLNGTNMTSEATDCVGGINIPGEIVMVFFYLLVRLEPKGGELTTEEFFQALFCRSHLREGSGLESGGGAGTCDQDLVTQVS